MAKGRPRKTPGGDVLLRSAELIGWAVGGLEREIVETRQRLVALTRQAAQLRSRIAGSTTRGRGPAAAASFDEPGVQQATPARKKRQMSAAARKRISDMQKKRWAEWRKKKAAAK
jgi:hypothetical protein